jgi:hypothetical protein
LTHDRFESKDLTLAADMHHQGEEVLGVRPLIGSINSIRVPASVSGSIEMRP